MIQDHLVHKNIHFDTYICSPLTRTLQTFSIIFPDNKPIIEPLIREHLFHSCDVGRQPSSLKKDFTSFDFSNLNDFWWNNNKPINEKKIVKENFNDIKNRLDKFKLWLNECNSSCQRKVFEDEVHKSFFVLMDAILNQMRFEISQKEKELYD